MQAIQHTWIDPKGGWCHEDGSNPLLFYVNASFRLGDRDEVFVPCIDWIDALLKAPCLHGTE